MAVQLCEKVSIYGYSFEGNYYFAKVHNGSKVDKKTGKKIKKKEGEQVIFKAVEPPKDAAWGAGEEPPEQQEPEAAAAGGRRRLQVRGGTQQPRRHGNRRRLSSQLASFGLRACYYGMASLLIHVSAPPRIRERPFPFFPILFSIPRRPLLPRACSTPCPFASFLPPSRHSKSSTQLPSVSTGLADIPPSLRARDPLLPPFVFVPLLINVFLRSVLCMPSGHSEERPPLGRGEGVHEAPQRSPQHRVAPGQIRAVRGQG